MLIFALGYFFVTDPFNVKPMLFGSSSQNTAHPSSATSDTSGIQGDSASTANGSVFSDTQVKALETFGIDPTTLPSSITPEQEACFVEKLGQPRVDEIKAGGSPTAMEFFKAKDCV